MKNAKNSDSPQMNADRRRFFAVAGSAIGAAAIVGAFPRAARADDPPHVTPEDPTAKALNYTEDNTKAPAPHQAGQSCASCNFFHGGAKGYGPCDLFPGKSTNAAGWCSGYVKKA